MSFSVWRKPHKPLRASHSVIRSQTHREQERDSTSGAEVKPCGDARRNPSDMTEGITKKKHLTLVASLDQVMMLTLTEK